MHKGKTMLGAMMLWASVAPALATTLTTTVKPTLAVNMMYTSVEDCVAKINKVKGLSTVTKVEGVNPENNTLAELDDVQEHCQLLIKPNKNTSQPAPPPTSGAVACNMEKDVSYGIPQGYGCTAEPNWYVNHVKSFSVYGQKDPVKTAAECAEKCASFGKAGICRFTHQHWSNAEDTYLCSITYNISSCQVVKNAQPPAGNMVELSSGYCQL